MVWLFLWNPGEFNMLGANGSFSAKVFFCSKTLALRKSAALLCGAPFRAASFLSTQDKKGREINDFTAFLQFSDKNTRLIYRLFLER